MIQRIQSIWLLCAAFTILCLLFIPTLGAVASGGYYTLYASGLKIDGIANQATNYPLLISTVLAGLISLVNIFNFRNRKLQIRIASFNIVLILALSFWMSQLVNGLPALTTLDIEPGLFLPIVAIIFTLLAIRGIKNDEKLIRSADRLR
ncbi:MAG: DUF4293 domain-containing protein [Pedobacter sp.]|uniref:DUF4293 domain-containing protein n=1 Tax=Pedobacter sp. TaxID=1411316 RepID=UPI00280A1076|nr:DUF4293 domain-containing protein [Pedobacter sp.]MDQ8005639.1 DUF4293 domain-containing protein [Pedobacter sp.]